jgi:hypothetical protein
LDSEHHFSKTGFDDESEDDGIGDVEPKQLDETAFQFDAGQSQVGESVSSDHLSITDRRSDVLVQDISACVAVAFSMLPFKPPEPIWKQGVWADIFGEGSFLKSSWLQGGLSGRPMALMPAIQSDGVGATEQRAKVQKNLQQWLHLCWHRCA